MTPKTRGDCLHGPRPCPHHGCRYHLGKSPTGDSCSLDVADEGEHSLEEIGEVLGLTRERIRQIEEASLAKLEPRVAAILRDPGETRAHRLELVEQALMRCPPPPPKVSWRVQTSEQKRADSERQKRNRANETPEQRRTRLQYLRDYRSRRKEAREAIKEGAEAAE